MFLLGALVTLLFLNWKGKIICKKFAKRVLAHELKEHAQERMLSKSLNASLKKEILQQKVKIASLEQQLQQETLRRGKKF